MEQPHEKRGGRPPRVKNKNAAPVQVTAEQILREATERTEPALRPPKQKILDGEELADYRLRRRKDFEDTIRRTRLNIGAWFKYAAWEESQREFERSRSVYERCLDVDRRHVGTWLKYIEMEIKNKFINHARNLFDHAVTTLPRVDQFWYKFTYMEEMIGHIANARQIFERWMQWEPDESAWSAYIKLEKRYNEIDRARAIFERFVAVHPEPKNWLKWVKFEEEQNNLARVREIFDQAILVLGDDFMDQRIFIAFAKFETKVKEFDRARVIFKYALERLPRSKSETLYKQYIQFEKQYGDKEGIEDVVVSKRRVQYEQEVSANPRNYDAWFDYVRLEESTGELNKVREIYERAIASVPPTEEKRYWRRYIYLWIYYALYEELTTKDINRARQVYKQCLKLIPHKKFTFAKIWLLFAKFEIRNGSLTDARKNLGMAIGMCPKKKLFDGYIELETQLFEFDRCRQLYQKQLEWDSTSCAAWKSFADLEKSLDDIERARGIFELAIGQPSLDMPEVLWKAFIDFEIGQFEFERTRALYERLLERTEHFKVWISYAHFEFSAPSAAFIEAHNLDADDDEEDVELPEPDAEELSDRCARARKLFRRADDRAKQRDLKEDRVVLLEAWRDFEKRYGTAESRDEVGRKMPKVVKRRRRVDGGEGGAGGAVAWEEYFDYLFPDEQSAKPNLKLLAMAHAWAKKKAQDTEASPATSETAASPVRTESEADAHSDEDEENRDEDQDRNEDVDQDRNEDEDQGRNEDERNEDEDGDQDQDRDRGQNQDEEEEP